MSEPADKKIKKAIERKNWSLVVHLLPSLPQDEWENNYREIMNNFLTGDFQQRWEMMKVFSGLGERAIIDLVEILKEEKEDQQLRWFAVGILAGFKHPAVLPALTELIADNEEKELKEIAVKSLAAMGVEVINIITPLLEEESTRLSAVKCLAVIPHRDIIEPLLKVVDEPRVEVRRTVIEALGKFSDGRLVPVMLNALRDEDKEVKKQALLAIAYLADNYPEITWSEYIYPLIEDEALGEIAVRALGRIDTPDCVDKLARYLRLGVSEGVKQKIVRVLGWSQQPSALDHLQEQLKEASTPTLIQKEIVQVVGRNKEAIKRKKAVSILLNFYETHQAFISCEIKQSLAESWGELGEEEALPSLQRLTRDEDMRVRLHALAALKKIPAGVLL